MNLMKLIAQEISKSRIFPQVVHDDSDYEECIYFKDSSNKWYVMTECDIPEHIVKDDK